MRHSRPWTWNFIGWIVIGFLAGSISGWFVSSRSPQGCLATIVVGVVGGLIGGWLSSALGLGQVQGFIGALMFATIGAIIVAACVRQAHRGRRR
jgi:uncharacterized membrane protein YeaQ/YmgE (transglycosylase-associated protein family)